MKILQGDEMHKSGRSESGVVRGEFSTLSFNSSLNNSVGLGNISDRDLLSYMADMLLELEELAVFRQLDGVADLLGCAHRAIQRNQK